VLTRRINLHRVDCASTYILEIDIPKYPEYEARREARLTPAITAICCFALYLIGYHLYARWIGARVFQLDGDAVTPAYELQDNYDYVPARKYVLFGHHYASIAGLAPMLGPAIAVIWGWVPAMFWVVFGTLFIGAVHDFGALVVSMRFGGKSIGKVAESVIGPRPKTLFHLIIFFLTALAMGVFVQVVAQLFSASYYPQSFFPSATLIVLAMVMGVLLYKKGFPLGPLAAIGFALTLAAIYVAPVLDAPDLSIGTWSGALLLYAFLASVLPVWLLLQPRDFLNSLLLYLGLASILLGFFLLNPDFAAPPIEKEPEGAPPMYPFVFIIIACGAVSGFHGLVSSGTTAKQISKETDAKFIGYGGMIGESLLGLVAVLACTAGFISHDAWQVHYASWDLAKGLGISMAAFINGSALFLSQLGISQEIGQTFVALVAVSFALTTLDSATRLLRFNIEEIAETARMPFLQNRAVASLLAVLAIGFFAFYEIDGKPAGLALWALFGTTNQILGGLTLLTVTLYLVQEKRNFWCTLIPMLFMLVTTLTAMGIGIKNYIEQESYLLLFIGSLLVFLALWVIVEGLIRFAYERRLNATGDG